MKNILNFSTRFAMLLQFLMISTPFLIMVFGCKHVDDGSKSYYDLQCVIVSMNGNDVVNTGKLNTPTHMKSILIYAPRIRMYAELGSSNIITTKWFYNHKPGDTIFFKQILRERFFSINR